MGSGVDGVCEIPKVARLLSFTSNVFRHVPDFHTGGKSDRQELRYGIDSCVFLFYFSCKHGVYARKTCHCTLIPCHEISLDMQLPKRNHDSHKIYGARFAILLRDFFLSYPL